MVSLPPKIRRFGIAVVVMLLSLLLVWWSVWSIAASQYRDFIDSWIAMHREAGYDVTYEERTPEGFPRIISLHFTNFVLQNSDGVKIHANDVSLTTFPWQWHRFDAKLKHGFDISIPFANDKTLYIATDATARDHTELDENGDWKSIDLTLANAKALWGSDPFFGAQKFAIELLRPDAPPKDHKEAGLTMTGSADDLVLPPGLDDPFGAKLAKIDIAMRVMGTVPDPRKKKSVAEWSSSGGTVEFDKFFLEWGPLILASHGTLGLDDDLQPEGAFSAQIGNHHEVLKTLIAANYIPKRQQGMLDSALDLFTKRTTVAGKAGIEAPIAVQLGGLFLGPVRVFEFSDIEWEGIPVTAPVVPEAAAPDQPALAVPNIIAPQPALPALPAR